MTDETDERGATSTAAGPDWGQFVLVVLAVLVLALAAVAVPALGGISVGGSPLDSPRDGPDQLAELTDGDGEQGSDSGDGNGDGDGDDDSEADGDGDTEDGDSDEDAGTGDDGAPDDDDGAPDDIGDDVLDDEDSGEEPGSEFDEDGHEEHDGEDGVDEDGDPDDSFDEGGDPDGDRDDGFDDGGADEADAGPEDDGFDDGDTGPDDAFDDGDAEPGDSDGDDGAFDEDGAPGEEGSGEDADGGTDADDAVPGDEADETNAEPDEPDEADGDDPDGAAGEDADGTGGSDEDGIDETDGTDDGDVDDADDADDEDVTEPDDEDVTDETEPDDEATEIEYDLAFENDPTPGGQATVRLTGDGDPVEGATVYFNDEDVGATDSEGRVTGDVPFTQTLTVVAEPPGTDATETETEGSQARLAGVFAHGASVGLAGGSTNAQLQEATNGTETTVEMDADTAIEVDDPPIAGTTTTVTATVSDNPIPAGTVRLDGEDVGTTDADGTVEIALPESPGNATVAVERDEIRAERTIEVEDLTLEVTDLVPLPGRTVDAGLHHGDDPIANATVLVDGETAATTAEDGVAAVELPVASEARLTAEYAGTTAETTVTGLYRTAAAVALAALAVLGLVGRVLVRRFGVTRETLRSLPSRVAGVLTGLGRRTVDAVVRAARGLEGFGHWLVARGREAGDLLRRASRWLVALPGELADRGLAALAAIHPLRLYRGFLGLVRSLFASSQKRVRETTGLGASSATATEDAAAPEESVLTLRDLWREFVRLVRPPRMRTKTPGEIGRYAVEKGFPEPPVRTVVETFRDTEYGNRNPSEGRLERVETAVQSVAGDPDGPDETDADALHHGTIDATEGTNDDSDEGVSESNANDDRDEDAIEDATAGGDQA